ncbi:Carboxylesterase 4A [Apodemus speciosus]|uniref:Carboxylic ester hydrolase n=1 Tax=Apodemus speciosus TaxID=105296 RepID=A0ABQ0F2Q6_APOSI
MKRILDWSLILCLIQTALGASHTKEPLLITKHGILQGKQVYVGDTPVQVFLGVPFSKPPVGTRRFAPPEPPLPWDGIRDATIYPPSCLQESWGQLMSMYINTRKQYEWLHFSEDCLYLNVYAPVLAPGDPLLPVMVWFPGGAFLVGSASSYEGSELAARGKVVLVFLQYRLGILGFLSTGNSHARGNWGLLDQIAALRWVQENIEAFGGDPDSVTLFGQSAGAMSVSGLRVSLYSPGCPGTHSVDQTGLELRNLPASASQVLGLKAWAMDLGTIWEVMSPLAQGLFHQAISQSGTAVLKLFITPDPLRLAKKVAHLAGCDHNSTKIMVECLRALPAEEVMRVSKKMTFFHVNFQKDPKEIVWFLSPVVDGVVFPEDPVVLLTHGQVKPVPYLLGVNSAEFEWNLPFLMKLRISQRVMNETYVSKLLGSFSILLNITKEQVPLVASEYLNDAVSNHDWKMFRNHLIDLVGDATFVYATLQAAQYHRDAGSPVYLYEFKHHAPSGIIVKPRDGADHGDELSYLFGSPFSKGPDTSSTGEEKEFSLQMMKYWANFAHTGNPNDEKLPYWPRFDKDEKYLQLDFDTRVGVKLKEEKMAFWRRLRQPQKP